MCVWGGVDRMERVVEERERERGVANGRGSNVWGRRKRGRGKIQRGCREESCV